MARTWCSEKTLQDLPVLASSRNTKINRTLLVFHGRACCQTWPYRTCVGQAWLICFNLGTSCIKTIVNFAGLYCMSGTGFHALNACTQWILWWKCAKFLFEIVKAIHSINRKKWIIMSHFVTFCTRSLKCILQRESFKEITTVTALL